MKITRIICLFVLFVCWLPAGGFTQTQPDLQQLDQYMAKAVQDFDLTGLSVAIVKDGRVVFKKGYGYKNVDKKEAMDTGALFNIASCTKAMTAACMAMLVEEGKLHWKDKVIDYIPEFRLAEPYLTKEMNILDILSHRSGLGTFYGDLLWYETNYSPEDIIKRMRYLPLTNDFRSEFGYQNNMFMIAGEIIRKITGKSWSEFVYERIFQPLGMKESKTCSKDLQAGQNIAYPHLSRKRQEIALYDPNPAGTVYSSVEEMAHWIGMLLNGGMWQEKKILQPQSLDMLFGAKTILPVSGFMKRAGTHFRAYGLGWFLFDYAGRKIIEHDGGMPGYISKVTLVPEEHLGLVLLTNDMNILTGALRYKVIDTYLQGSQRDWAAEFLTFKQRRDTAKEKQKADRLAKRLPNTRPSLPPAGYTGLYRDKMYGDATVALQDSQLVLTLLPAKKLFTSPMTHWHLDTFRIKFRDEFLPEGYITFSFNANAEVTGFKIDLPNPDFHFFNLDFKKVKQ